MLDLFSNKKYFKKFQFNDFFSIKGNLIRSSKGRETLEFKLHNKIFFIKRFTKGNFFNKWLNDLNFISGINQASNEFKAYFHLKKANINTPKLVCYGDEGKLFNNHSFVVSEKLANIQQLDDFIKENKALSSKDQAKIFQEIVKIINNMHLNGIVHFDLYLCHFLIDINTFKKEKKIKIFLIDYHRIKVMKKISINRLIKEHGDLLFSMMLVNKNNIFIKELKDNYFNPIFIKDFMPLIHKRALRLIDKYKRKYV
jgi:heptose I phosphotransferase